MVDHRFSARALSKLSATLPVEGATPASTRRWVNRSEVYWLALVAVEDQLPSAHLAREDRVVQGRQIATAADPLPDDLCEAIAKISGQLEH
jgi:hypothetical protein